MQIITASAVKGGVGKTITVGSLAQAAAYRGRRVLAVDLDRQINLSFMLAADITRPGSDQLLAGKDPAELIQHTAAGIDVIPGSDALADEITRKGSARRLQNALEPLKSRYDLIVLDTPTGGELFYNTLQAATGLIIPLWAEPFSVVSLYQIMRNVQQIQETSNPELKILGFILSMYDARSNLARQMQETITERAAAMGVPYLGAVRKAVAVQEAAALQTSLFEYAPNCKPAQDYLQIYDALKI